MTIKNFVNKYNVSIENEWTDKNPNMDSKTRMIHWKSTLRMGRRLMALIFSQGLGIAGEPEAESVLCCLKSDSYCADFSFEEFCNEFGYDEDSRQAKRTHDAIITQSKKLRRFMNDRYDEFMDCEE